MAKSKEINMKLPALDDLFSTQEQRDEASRESVRNIPISEISDFPNHPFKVKMDENMSELVDSIKEHGVLVPALVRPKEDGTYEMVAGHRRKFASEMAELEEIPCIIRDLTDDESTLIMVDSNLQRERILPSEKAFAYRHMEQSEIWEPTLNERAVDVRESVEDIVFRNLQNEKVHRAIGILPEVQQRRVKMYFFDGMTYEEIADKENCKHPAVVKSVKAALDKLKIILEE